MQKNNKPTDQQIDEWNLFSPSSWFNGRDYGDGTSRDDVRAQDAAKNVEVGRNEIQMKQAKIDLEQLKQLTAKLQAMSTPAAPVAPVATNAASLKTAQDAAAKKENVSYFLNKLRMLEAEVQKTSDTGKADRDALIKQITDLQAKITQAFGGDTVPEEVQAIFLDAGKAIKAATDMNNVQVPAPVDISAPTTTVQVGEPIPPSTIQTTLLPDPVKEPANRDAMSFGQAFRSARLAGEKQFTWRGKPYTTELAKTDPAQGAKKADPRDAEAGMSRGTRPAKTFSQDVEDRKKALTPVLPTITPQSTPSKVVPNPNANLKTLPLPESMNESILSSLTLRLREKMLEATAPAQRGVPLPAGVTPSTAGLKPAAPAAAPKVAYDTNFPQATALALQDKLIAAGEKLTRDGKIGPATRAAMARHPEITTQTPDEKAAASGQDATASPAQAAMPTPTPAPAPAPAPAAPQTSMNTDDEAGAHAFDPTWGGTKATGGQDVAPNANATWDNNKQTAVANAAPAPAPAAGQAAMPAGVAGATSQTALPDSSEKEFDPTWGGTKAAADTRTGMEKFLPNFLGGKSAPEAANKNATWNNAQQAAVSNAPAPAQAAAPAAGQAAKPAAGVVTNGSGQVWKDRSGNPIQSGGGAPNYGKRGNPDNVGESTTFQNDELNRIISLVRHR